MEKIKGFWCGDLNIEEDEQWFASQLEPGGIIYGNPLILAIPFQAFRDGCFAVSEKGSVILVANDLKDSILENRQEMKAYAKRISESN